ncbi:hypothetical protein E2C01_078914 [Portunus trituberculatus]|uniref:Uncharacterized protein n=1 Tax=Portunus trituberculatus TaxID=210409 RepID=A0A5B7IRE0_PORTR|nr:hypothetical protein [Portunus trituberculatus]
MRRKPFVTHEDSGQEAPRHLNTMRSKYHIRNSATAPFAPSEEAQPTLGPWTGFEPVRLETPRTAKHTWFHCTTATLKGRRSGRRQGE